MQTDAGITLSQPLVTCQELGSDVMSVRQDSNKVVMCTSQQ